VSERAIQLISASFQRRILNDDKTISVLMDDHIPTAQKAIIQDETGRFVLCDNAPVPPLRPGTVLVRTAAVAINPVDYKMGTAFPSGGTIVGMDLSEYIIAIHSSVKAIRNDLHIRDLVSGLVYGSNPSNHQEGSFAQYVIVHAEFVLSVPNSWSVEKSATLGLAVSTSCVALWCALGIKPTPHKHAREASPVLVYGGSTSSGTIAIQLLKL
jgi:NADPH:quinone reductase-like Zn-dependent oxidoreductase